MASNLHGLDPSKKNRAKKPTVGFCLFGSYGKVHSTVKEDMSFNAKAQRRKDAKGKRQINFVDFIFLHFFFASLRLCVFALKIRPQSDLDPTLIQP
jgi:hypothetical protein